MLLAAMCPRAGHRGNPGLAHSRALGRAHQTGPGMPDRGSQSLLDPMPPPQLSSGDIA